MKKLFTALAIIILILFVGFVVAVSLSACGTPADVAQQNISKDADNFRVLRRVVFFNGITDKYLLEIVGRCSIDLSRPRVIAVTVQTGPSQFKKHYLGLSDNVSYFVEQLEPISESTYFYKVNFRPTEIIPNIDMP